MGKISVKMLVSITGNAVPIYGLEIFSFAPGDIVELHPDLAAAWIAGGIAEGVPYMEAAVLPEPENAAMFPPTNKGRKKRGA